MFWPRLLLILFFIQQAAFAQQILQGTVVDKETGKPVPFASIGVAGTSKGTSTNLNGEFSLSISGVVTIKITCVGYETLTLSSSDDLKLIRLSPAATQLSEVVIMGRSVNPRAIVRKAFASISRNYESKDFLQKFFYRHYCKDDSVYGRLIEATVDVYKHQGYRFMRKAAGDKEDIRITQIRRSLDNTLMAQGHEAISVKNILQADVAGYQSYQESEHLKFYDEISNLQADFNHYNFEFDGVTNFDEEQVYKISYTYRKDSILTTAGYLKAPAAHGVVYIAMNTYAFLKTEDVRTDGPNTISTSAYYRKQGDKYYAYHFVREGENRFDDNHQHAFHIELMSVDIKTGEPERFISQNMSKEELLKIPYDSVFWSTQTVLKTTPLEDEIIRDLGGGQSLNKQFYRYQQYEWSTHLGGENGEEKFNWLINDSKDSRILCIFFWTNKFDTYLAELEYFKRLNRSYHGKIYFVLASLDEDAMKWQQLINRYNLFSDGIINYRISRNNEIVKHFRVKETPAYVIVSKDGSVYNYNAPPPGSSNLESEFNLLLNKSN